jgi:hypothetical protein
MINFFSPGVLGDSTRNLDMPMVIMTCTAICLR